MFVLFAGFNNFKFNNIYSFCLFVDLGSLCLSGYLIRMVVRGQTSKADKTLMRNRANTYWCFECNSYFCIDCLFHCFMAAKCVAKTVWMYRQL